MAETSLRRNLIDMALIGLLLALLIAVPHALADDCQDHNWDVWKVGKALQQGITKEAVIAHLDGSRQELTSERMILIRALIEDAYQFNGDQAQEWWERHKWDCEGA